MTTFTTPPTINRTDPTVEHKWPSAVTARVLDGFDDPDVGPEAWNALVRRGDSDVVYLTWQFQHAWWTTLGRGQLLLVAAWRDGQLAAIAPFYVDSGMIFFVGSGVADYMDFIGDITDPAVCDALLATARLHAPGFVGFRLHCVLGTSRTGQAIQRAAAQLGLTCYEERRWSAPAVDLAQHRDRLLAAIDDRNLVKRERYFARRGALVFNQVDTQAAMQPYLDVFFEQHISRYAMAAGRSPFLNRAHRAFIEQLTGTATASRWLKLNLLEWDGRPIAMEFGLSYGATYFSGPSSYAGDLAARAPGQVLLRRVLLAGVQAGLATCDLGIGDDSCKFLFATRLRHVHTWGLYPTAFLPRLAS